MTSDEAAAHGGGTARTAGPPAFDTSVAHQARMYDYLLSGKDNYAADRAAMDAWLTIHPDAAFSAVANRAFLGRVVRYLAAEAGIRQFLDIGTGIPTAGNTHQVVRAVAPESRVVCVDHDPVVLSHARALLESSEPGGTVYIDADFRDIGTILARARELLDFTRPVAIILVALLHAVPDADNPHAIVATLLDAVPPGSYIALSHLGADLLSQESRDGVTDISNRMMQQQISPRSREQVARFFEGADLLEPGIVRLEEWRAEPRTGDEGRSSLWAAAGRKR